MSKKKVGLWVDSRVSDDFDEFAAATDRYKGDLVTAALLHFMRATPEARLAVLKEVAMRDLEETFRTTPERSAASENKTIATKPAKNPKPTKI